MRNSLLQCRWVTLSIVLMILLFVPRVDGQGTCSTQYYGGACPWGRGPTW